MIAWLIAILSPPSYVRCGLCRCVVPCQSSPHTSPCPSASPFTPLIAPSTPPHALPLSIPLLLLSAVNGEMELFTPDLLEFGIQLSQDLARTLKRPGPLPNTISQRDVPGTTRAIIPHLNATGVLAMSIGVNFGSAPVVVPSISLWRDIPSNTSIYLLYHGRGYGGIASITDYAQAVNFSHVLGLDWRGDNSGPPSATELIQNFASIKALWPGREVKISTFEEFTTLLHAAVTGGNGEDRAEHRHGQRGSVGAGLQLPEFTNEMGNSTHTSRSSFSAASLCGSAHSGVVSY